MDKEEQIVYVPYEKRTDLAVCQLNNKVELERVSFVKPIPLSSLIKEHSIGFAEWIQENNFRHTRDGWFNVRAKIEFKIKFYTTTELFDLYIEDLNKLNKDGRQ